MGRYGGRASIVMDGFYCVFWPHNDCLFLQDIKENDLGWAAARPYLLAQRNTLLYVIMLDFGRGVGRFYLKWNQFLVHLQNVM